MNKNDFGQVVSILANVGVIAGIVFLALELRQNNELLAAQARRDQLDARTAAGTIELNNEQIANLTFKVESSQQLTPFEEHRFHAWAIYLFSNWEWQFDEYRAGILSESDLPVGGWRDRLQQLPKLREIWDVSKESRSAEFISFVEGSVLTN